MAGAYAYGKFSGLLEQKQTLHYRFTILFARAERIID